MQQSTKSQNYFTGEIGRTIFVGRISHQTSSNDWKTFFETFGTITGSFLGPTNDRNGLRFGFITFRDPEPVSLLVDFGGLYLSGRMMSIYPYNPEKIRYPAIYLGGLPEEVTGAELRAHFCRYGNVVRVQTFYRNGKSRGFAFLYFEKNESAILCCRERFVKFHGKKVKVEPREGNEGRNDGRTIGRVASSSMAPNIDSEPPSCQRFDGPAGNHDTRYSYSRHVHTTQNVNAPPSAPFYNIVTYGHHCYNTLEPFFLRNSRWHSVGLSWSQFYSPQ